MNTETELITLQNRLRAVRESRGLTLVQAASKSSGAISAIALGSYERGDRSISASKLLEIARIYQIPVAELFTEKNLSASNKRVIVDLRKLAHVEDQVALAIKEIIKRITTFRRDWNGEVISLRESDIASLQIFALFSAFEIEEIVNRFQFTTNSL